MRIEIDVPGADTILEEAGTPLYMSEVAALAAQQIAQSLLDDSSAAFRAVGRAIDDDAWLRIGRYEIGVRPDRRLELRSESISGSPNG